MKEELRSEVILKRQKEIFLDRFRIVTNVAVSSLHSWRNG